MKCKCLSNLFAVLGKTLILVVVIAGLIAPNVVANYADNLSHNTDSTIYQTVSSAVEDSYFNHFTDLDGWVLGEGLVGARCGIPLPQKDSVVYATCSSAGAPAGYVELPNPVVSSSSRAVTVDIRFRYDDIGGFFIALMKDNDSPCINYANDGFVLGLGGEGMDAIHFYLTEGGVYTSDILVPTTHDGNWHIARLVRDENGYWSMYIDGVFQGTGTHQDLDTNYRYLTVQAYASCSAIAEFDYIAVSEAPTPYKPLGALKHTPSVPDIVASTIVADWDSDGKNEIVALHGVGDPNAPNGYVAAYEFDGTQYVRELKLASPTLNPRSAAVGDVNGDGKNEIVMGTGTGGSADGGYIYVISDGAIIWTSNWIESIRFPAELCVGNTDDDPEDEIGLAVSWYGRYLTLYDHTGGNSFSEVFRLHEGDGQGCAIGDIDGDGKNELVYGTGSWSGRVKAFKFNGSGYSRLWDVNVFYPYRAYVNVGDTDGDGVDEVVVTSGEGSNPATAILEGDGSTRWVGGPYGDHIGQRRPSTVGSWFNDGKNQIAFVAGHGDEYMIHIVEHDGVAYRDAGILNRDNSLLTFIRPYIGDADNDGLNELVLPERFADDDFRINVYTAVSPYRLYLPRLLRDAL